MNVWWVNRKQTARQELAGGYLWSPKRMSNGSRSQYYEFMRETRPGDVVVSFANARIGHYGIVTGFPISAPKPDEFGRAGEYWSDDGWLVPVSWEAVAQPFRPKDNMAALQPLLPERYAPIQANGNGNQAAYLTKIDQALLDELVRLGAFDPDQSSADQDLADDEAIIEEIEDKIQARIEADRTLSDTETAALVKARKGQGAFRRNVERMEPRCRVTGLEDKRLLIASHIQALARLYDGPGASRWREWASSCSSCRSALRHGPHLVREGRRHVRVSYARRQRSRLPGSRTRP